ncbi:hypothetical protein NIES30_12875 [Phormidium tenue NIES-30]|uniref:Uncharacterized protein n=1 Tax=Phormidium tenue NIES-30 TaxID=549789 RepID=A0A1U7J5G1_9CYAN|nr:hypothetical protein NIES30_12875 [Phormidium tenue NIES-30]
MVAAVGSQVVSTICVANLVNRRAYPLRFCFLFDPLALFSLTAMQISITNWYYGFFYTTGSGLW